MTFKSLFFLSFLILIFIFLPANFIRAQCTAVWNEYSCESTNCGGNILTRTCHEYCCQWCESCSQVCDAEGNCTEECTTYCCGCCTSCGSSSVFKTCESWQTCQNGGWSTSIPSCKCTGYCLEIPKNPRYYDNPEYPRDPFNPEESKDPSNIFLPVKLDWDDVRGWVGGWKENSTVKTCSEECVQSYKVRFENTTKDGYSTGVNKSEYNYREDPNAGACLLKSGATTTWHVSGCCNQDGTNCGPESNFQFKTNSAPEPIEPYDPDWNGTKKAGDLPLPSKLTWCNFENKDIYPGRMGYDGIFHYFPLSFKFSLYYGDYSEENRNNYYCYPDLVKGDKCELVLKPNGAQGELWPKAEFPNDEYGYITKLHSYAWKASACKDEAATECSDFSQEWLFSTKEFSLAPPKLVSPPNDKENPISFPVLLQWEGATGSHSYVLEIKEVGGETTILHKTLLPNANFDYPQLSIDKLYKWKVQPCWDFESKECENVWSEEYYFKTTGRPPKPETMKPVGENIPIPVNFEWENVPGAKSYRIKVWGDGLDLEKPVNEAKFYLDYPDLKQERTYSWQVKTCARENGEICGEWSETKSFKTFKLSAPSNPSPKDNEEIFTYQMPMVFSWNSVSGARYYEYVINYVEKSPEEASECPTGKVIDKIVSNTSDLVSLNCLGKYQWQVRACLDKDCQEAGDWSNLWNFTLSQKVPPGGGGLVPCGRDYDDPKTPWNEREPCQIKHLFLLLRNILDFLFWKVGSIILVLLVIITGIIYYFSIFSPEILGEWAAIANVKSIWKYAGIGYGIVFLAWLIINLFLALAGYKFQIFGHWWEIKF